MLSYIHMNWAYRCLAVFNFFFFFFIFNCFFYCHKPKHRHKHTEGNVAYTLTSVLRHVATGVDKTDWTSGHYVTWAKRDGIWFSFNDHTVSELQNNNIDPLQPEDLYNGGVPYTLFYTKMPQCNRQLFWKLTHKQTNNNLISTPYSGYWL